MNLRSTGLVLLVLCGCGELPVVFPEDAGSRMCGASNPCRTPLVCDVGGECVECVTDVNCAAPSPACDPVTKRCVPCRGAVGCTAPYVCSPSAPVCVLPCLGGNDCPGFIDACRANVCSACNDPEDCAEGMFCDVPHGRCVACLADANCGGTTPKCNQATGLCEACIRNLDCVSGGTCFLGSCR